MGYLMKDYSQAIEKLANQKLELAKKHGDGKFYETTLEQQLVSYLYDQKLFIVKREVDKRYRELLEENGLEDTQTSRPKNKM